MINQAAILKKIVEQKRKAEYSKLIDQRQVNQKVIAIASGKGGVGKTSLAVNLGILFSRHKKTLVFDADLGLSNVNILLGAVPKYNLYDVFKGERSLKEVICKTKYNLDIISGGTGFHELSNLANEEKMLLMGQLSYLKDYNLIIIDLSAGISDNVISFLRLANMVLVVTTPEPTAITDAYGMIKVLSLKSNIANINLIVNRVDSIKEGQEVSKKIKDISLKYLKVSIDYVGMVFQDEIVTRALYKRIPYVCFNKEAKCSVSIKDLSDNLLKKLDNDFFLEQKKKSFLSRIFSTF